MRGQASLKPGGPGPGEKEEPAGRQAGLAPNLGRTAGRARSSSVHAKSPAEQSDSEARLAALLAPSFANTGKWRTECHSRVDSPKEGHTAHLVSKARGAVPPCKEPRALASSTPAEAAHSGELKLTSPGLTTAHRSPAVPPRPAALPSRGIWCQPSAPHSPGASKLESTWSQRLTGLTSSPFSRPFPLQAEGTRDALANQGPNPRAQGPSSCLASPAGPTWSAT